MSLETLPRLVGSLVLLIGLAVVADASTPPLTAARRERRRRARAVPSRAGESAVGAGLLLVGAALVGGDQWRWDTVAVFAGTVLLLAGIVLNWRYLRERITFRGAARRGRTADDDRRHLGDPVAPEPHADRRPNDRRWTERRDRAGR